MSLDFEGAIMPMAETKMIFALPTVNRAMLELSLLAPNSAASITTPSNEHQAHPPSHLRLKAANRA